MKYRVCFLGDSITEMYCASTKEGCFVSLIGKEEDFEVYNFGLTTTRIAEQKNNYAPEYDKKTFITRAITMPKDKDMYVVVMGGTNDFGHGDAPLGNDKDTSLYTFTGATKNLFKYLSDNYDNKKVIIIPPLHRWDEDSTKGSYYNTKDDGAATLDQYIEVLIKYAQEYGFNICNIRDELGIPKDDKNNGCYFDGVHPNNEGHKLLAKLISSYIRSY